MFSFLPLWCFCWPLVVDVVVNQHVTTAAVLLWTACLLFSLKTDVLSSDCLIKPSYSCILFQHAAPERTTCVWPGQIPFSISLTFRPLFLSSLSPYLVNVSVFHSAFVSGSVLHRSPPPWLSTSPVWLLWRCSICWFWERGCGLLARPGGLRGRAKAIGPKWCCLETGISAYWLGFSPWPVCWLVCATP